MKRFISTCLALFAAMQVMAQDNNTADLTGMRAGGKIYVVIAVIAVIWIGFGVLLFSMDSRLKKLEKQIPGK